MTWYDMHMRILSSRTAHDHGIVMQAQAGAHAHIAAVHVAKYNSIHMPYAWYHEIS